MGGKYTDAQRRAAEKYLAEKTDDIRIRAPKGTKEKWKAKAEQSGMSLNRLVITLLDNYEPSQKTAP